jgi:OFA family oxalate/formate antiporter-like MFS transporter
MVFTIAACVFGFSFMFAGRLQDRLGPVPGSIFGGLLVNLSFYLSSFTNSLGYLYFCYGVIGGIGGGFGYASAIPVVAKWFPDKRGLAVGIVVGGGAGSAVFGPLAQLKLIPAYGLWTHGNLTAVRLCVYRGRLR